MGGVTGLAAGSLGVYGATARYPTFRALTLPFKAFLIISSGTFASIIAADSYSRRFEASKHPEKDYQDEQQTFAEQVAAQKSTKDKVMQWCGDNRYSLVFGSWVASISVAMGIINRNPYQTTQQKLVQARVWAQGATVAAVIVSLAFEGSDRMSQSGRWETVKILDPNDPTHKRFIEKKIHHERYAGEDQWMDMVEAEEQRLKERERAVKHREEADKKSGKASKASKSNADHLEKGKPEDSKDEKLNAA